LKKTDKKTSWKVFGAFYGNSNFEWLITFEQIIRKTILKVIQARGYALQVYRKFQPNLMIIFKKTTKKTSLQVFGAFYGNFTFEWLITFEPIIIKTILKVKQARGIALQVYRKFQPSLMIISKKLQKKLPFKFFGRFMAIPTLND